MKVSMRGLATLLFAMAVAVQAHAQEKSTPSTEREKVSTMIGDDVGQSLAPAAQDIDFAAFEKALRNALAGGKPILSEDEVKTVGVALTQRVSARQGKPVPGLPPGSEPPAVAKDKVGHLLGADVGRSLSPIAEEIEVPVMLKAIRNRFAGGQSPLSEGETATLRETFAKRVQAMLERKATELAKRNSADGVAFLAKNRGEKGVITTASGLQYMVIRPGSGQRPRPDSRVRVNYEGRLLDGTVFDSSYRRNEPMDFGLGQVIAGWGEGLTLMPVGAKYRFWIPGDLAYGAKGSQGGIGPNATLVFDVELLDIL